jgi:hypothetical protein
MSGYLTDLKVCHVGLFVCLESADRHGRGQGPIVWHGYGPGQLRSVRTGDLVGSHRLLDRGGPSPFGEGHLDGAALLEEMGAVPH